MKELIRNNFYSMENNIKISFIIALFLAVVSFFVKHDAFIQMITAMELFIFIVNVGTSLYADIVSKWNKFERTLPVKYNDIIKAKYISFAIPILLGIVMGSITAIYAYVTNGCSNIQSIFYGYEFGLTLSAATAGIMYPLILKIGTEKNEMIMILQAITAVELLVLLSAILTPLTGEMNMKHPLVGLASAIVAVAIFIGSYFVSVKIYRHKEFS